MKFQKLALMILALSLGCAATAQTAYKGQLYINKEKFTIQGNLLRVQLRVSYNDNVLNNGETLNFTPVLKNGYRSKSLSSVVINSTERGKYEDRKAYFEDRIRSNVPVVTKDERHGTRYFIYDTTIPYSDWMHGAAFFVESEERGWGHKPHVYEDKVFKNIVISTCPASTVDPSIGGTARTGRYFSSTIAKTEWIQFLDPTRATSTELAICGTIPLSDSRKIGEMGTRKFDHAIYDELKKNLDAQLQVPGTVVRNVSVVGYGAPIGDFKRNEVKSSERALKLKQFLMNNHTTGSDGLTVTWVPEDWDSIYSLVDKSDMKLRGAVLDIIRTVDVTTGREDELKMLGDGSPYSFMQHYIFPEVCRIKYTAVFQRQSKEAGSANTTFNDNPRSMSLSQMYVTANNFRIGSKEFNDIMDLSARLFPDNAEANINAAGSALIRGNISKAQQYLKDWETDPRAYNNIGVMYMIQGNLAKADVYLKMAQAEGVEQASKVLEYLHNIEK